MTLPLHFTPEALDEYSDAIDWYEDQQRGLGKTFRFRVRECLMKIQANPRLYGTIEYNARSVKVPRHSYKIIYTILPDSITIQAIFHTSRDPKVWRRRVKKK